MLLMGKYVMTMNKTKRSFKDIVFKCTYNDGGVGQNGIGFTKTCSDKYIGKSVAKLFKYGEASPIKVFLRNK